MEQTQGTATMEARTADYAASPNHIPFKELVAPKAKPEGASAEGASVEDLVFIQTDREVGEAGEVTLH